MILTLQIINIILLVISIIGLVKFDKNINSVFDTLEEFVKNIAFKYQVIDILNSLKKKNSFLVTIMAAINLVFSIIAIMPSYSKIAIVFGIIDIIYFLAFNTYICLKSNKLNKFNKDLKEEIDNENKNFTN